MGQNSDDNNSNSNSRLKFIDGIEINRNEIHSSTNIVNQTPQYKIIIPIAVTENDLFDIENSKEWQFKYAQILDTTVESINNKQLFSLLDEWAHTKYRYGGNSKSGIDCSAFTGMLIGQMYGIELPRTAQEQFGVCEKIEKENLQEGDLVFFNTRRRGVGHVGYYLTNGFFAHSSTQEGVTISKLDEDYYQQRFISGGRLPSK